MTQTYKKPKGKSAPITINADVRRQIKSFTEGLSMWLDDPTVDEQSKEAIDYILNKLDTYDKNILLAYYAFESEGPCHLARLLGISPSIAVTRVKKIQQKIHDHIIPSISMSKS